LFFLDHLFECPGDEHIDGGAVESFFINDINTFESCDASGFHVVGIECFAIDAVVVADCSGVVHDCDDFGPHILEDLSTPAVYIPESKEGNFHAFDGDTDSWEHFCEGVGNTLPGSFFASCRATKFNGFSGDDAECVVMLVGGRHHVGISEPCHDLGVGADIWCGDIDIGSDLVHDGRAVASCESLDFSLGESTGIDIDAALAASEWDAYDGTLHGHEKGEGFDIIEVDIGVEPEAAFVWSTGVVVLDSVPFEEPMVPVVHFDGEVDHDLVFWLGEDDSGAMFEVDQLRRVEHGGDGLEVEVIRVVWESEFIGDGPTREFGRGCCCGHAWHPISNTHGLFRETFAAHASRISSISGGERGVIRSLQRPNDWLSDKAN